MISPPSPSIFFIDRNDDRARFMKKKNFDALNHACYGRLLLKNSKKLLNFYDFIIKVIL